MNYQIFPIQRVGHILWRPALVSKKKPASNTTAKIETDLFSLLGANFQGSAMSDEMAKYAAMHAQQMAMSAMSTMYPGMAGRGMMGKPGQQQNQGHILFVHGLPPDMNEEYLWQVIYRATLFVFSIVGPKQNAGSLDSCF